MEMLAEGKQKSARGEPMMVPRWDIVPIPDPRQSSKGRAIDQFPVDTVLG
jgi:hypothetical protein